MTEEGQQHSTATAATAGQLKRPTRRGSSGLLIPRRFPVAPKKHETDSASYKIGLDDKYPQRTTPTNKALPSTALAPDYKVNCTEADRCE
jgi:hypothetical protein